MSRRLTWKLTTIWCLWPQLTTLTFNSLNSRRISCPSVPQLSEGLSQAILALFCQVSTLLGISNWIWRRCNQVAIARWRQLARLSRESRMPWDNRIQSRRLNHKIDSILDRPLVETTRRRKSHKTLRRRARLSRWKMVVAASRLRLISSFFSHKRRLNCCSRSLRQIRLLTRFRSRRFEIRSRHNVPVWTRSRRHRSWASRSRTSRASTLSL